ncbi:restriction endonuclease subunit S [Photobacterium indicum]|uniref:Type I restriction endonuclease subunit S n=1 Tax=Photobacterium indicum TaxID=81447 RepID=A0A2T3L8I9_9GAMM|nr:restriction endonuclease subunit S [Photobacterium indicum]PSV47315.1 type I restriction endonuclease subunit S [Photobacterium indicum]
MSVETLITDNIDIWTSAIKTKLASGRGNGKKLELYGVKKLRELILELAVHGKLLPQDLNDEPAPVLLERIAEEKALLVKENKIKKQKVFPEITDEEKPFGEPKGWKWVSLQNLITVMDAGWSPACPPEPSPSDEKWGVLKTTAVQSMEYREHENKVLPVNKEPKHQYEVKTGDILITRAGPKNRVGVSCLVQRTRPRLMISDKIIRFHLVDIKMCERYISLCLNAGATAEYLDSAKSGMAESQMNISQDKLKSAPIPLAPLAEQLRIVTKVDELMALCDQLEQQTKSNIDAQKTLAEVLFATLTNSTDAGELTQNWARVSEHFDILLTTEYCIDLLKQTVLQLAITGKFVDFGNFEMKTVKQLLCFGPRNGVSPKEAPTPTDCKVLKLGATSYGYLNVEQSKFVDVDVDPESHLWLKEGDILIQRGNSATFVGSNVIVDKDYSGYIYPDLMMKLRTNELIASEYLSLVLSASSSRESMWSQMTGTSGTMPKISKKVVENVSIPVPADKQVQLEVVNEVNRIFSIIENLRLKLNQCQITQIHLADAIVAKSL